MANAERIDHVANLIKTQIKTAGVRPRAVVCSAMGKSTNNLLSAGEFALGEYYISIFLRMKSVKMIWGEDLLRLSDLRNLVIDNADSHISTHTL